MPHATDSATGFDTAVVDKEDHTVGLVQVKAHPVGVRRTAFLPHQLARFGGRIAFILTIDPDNMLFFKPEGESFVGPVVRLDTREVLTHYDPAFPEKRVFEPYLRTLVEAWLRDLAYHWKSDNPPGSEELRKAGLLEKVEGGTTQPLGA